MKILHIVPSYKPAYIYGGPIESVSKLCEGLAAAGHQVDVFTTTANGTTELDVTPGKVINVDGVNVTYFKRITKDPTHVSTDLWLHLWKNVKNYDIVNIQSWWNVLVVIAACIVHLKGVKLVITPRGMLSPYIFTTGAAKMKKIIHATMGKWALSKSYLHATAQVEFDEFREVIADCKGFIAPNNVTMPDTPIIKHHNEVFEVIFMSRVHPKKGIEILLNALAKVTFPVRLRIAGSGETDYTEKLQILTVELGIADKIEWMGWVSREDKFKALMDADLFALVSYNENFANVVIESLHMGTAVLVSEEVGLSGFVKESKTGWVTSLEIDDVAKQLTAAYADHEHRNWIRDNGRDLIEASFSEKKLIADYVLEYSKIIAN